MTRLSSRQLALATSVAAVAGLAFTVGWLQDVPLPRSAMRGDAAPAEWPLSRPIARDLEADMNLLVTKRPFSASLGAVPGSPGDALGAAGSGAANPTPPIQWRLGGIVMTETSRRLVVLVQPRPQSPERSELRAVGDTLPDGSIVQSIDAGSVSVNREGTLVTLRMFAKN